MENKESVLEQIKENYFYIYNKNKANELIEDWNDKKYQVKEAMSIGGIQKLDLENLNKLISPIHVDVEIQEPKVKLGWLPFLYLVGTFCLYSLVMLIPFGLIYSKSGLENQPGSDNGSSINNIIVCIAALIAIVRTYFKVKKWRKEEYNKLYEELNGENIRKANTANSLFENVKQETSIQVSTTMESIDDCKKLINKIDEKYIPEVKQQLVIIENNKPNLITVPASRKNESKFYLSLYDVVNSDQANSLGEAIRIVEDRTESGERTRAILNQIIASQHAIQNTIISVGDKIISNLNQNFEKTYEKIENVDKDLHSIRGSISWATRDIRNKQDVIIKQLELNHFDSKDIQTILNSIDINERSLYSEAAYGNRIFANSL